MQKLSPAPYLSKAEMKQLLQKNDWLAAWDVLLHWAWIAGAFALVYIWPNVWTVLVSLFVLGGKQLACAILMHDTSHQSVFSSRRLNDLIGQWLGAYPVFNNMKRYRPYHFKHHISTGLEDDPDLLLTRGYPTSRRSMFRKLFRDLSGQTGIKALIGLIMMHLGYLEYNLGGQVVRVSRKDRSWGEFFRTAAHNLGGPLLANLGLLGLLWWLASPWLYLLWIGAYLTTFQFSLRIRSIAEHSVVPDPTDPLRNTRTTYANPLERLLFAPYHVNYHLEHHMMMGVPSYQLPRMHKLIKARGFYETGLLEKNYWNVVKLAVGAKTPGN